MSWHDSFKNGDDEEYDERFDKIVDILENGQFQKMLDNIQVKNSA